MKKAFITSYKERGAAKNKESSKKELTDILVENINTMGAAVAGFATGAISRAVFGQSAYNSSNAGLVASVFVGSALLSSQTKPLDYIASPAIGITAYYTGVVCADYMFNVL